jgi:hypothetical protein
MPRRRGDTQVAHSNRSLATAVTINYYFNLAADFTWGYYSISRCKIWQYLVGLGDHIGRLINAGDYFLAVQG